MTHCVATPWGDVVFDDQVLAAHGADRVERPVRTVFAAAHVILKDSYAGLGHSLDAPGDGAAIANQVDWPATMAFRRHLDTHGFGVAEAMDTAQRFFLGWQGAKRLISECGDLDLTAGFCAGAGTDHVAAVRSTSDLIDGVVEQIRFIQRCGGIAVILPMPWLPLNDASERDYVTVYTEIIRQVEGPLILHWLGPMFLPVLEGYFPGNSFSEILAFDPSKVRGCKLSNLDSAQEYRVRHEILAREQVVLTGDDFHFGALIRGGAPEQSVDAVPSVDRWSELAGRPLALGDFSHGLLGIFDGTAVPAGLALRHLAAGNLEAYSALMEPCEALGQHVFAAPTQHYKAGLAFLAWLNGFQNTPMLVNREDLARTKEHLCEVARLASRAGAIVDASLAAERLRSFVEASSP